MMLLASAFSFLVLYVAMELLSYSLYTLVGMRRQRTESIESSVKYIIIGATASAIGLVWRLLHLRRDRQLEFRRDDRFAGVSDGTYRLAIAGFRAGSEFVPLQARGLPVPCMGARCI